MSDSGGRLRLRRLPLASAVALVAFAIAACTGDAGEPRPAAGSPAATGTTPSPSALPRSPAAPAPPREVSVVMSGDVLLHSGVWESARADAAARGRPGLDFRPMFAALEPVYSDADLAICHVETPLAEPDGPFSSYPIFSAPPQVVPGLKSAGIDACTTASNHSVDTGLEGLLRTLRTLDAHGIEHAGTAESRKDARRPELLDVAGVTVALLSYTYGTNGLPIPSEAPWSVPLIDTDRMLAMARRARAEGAEIVIVALHAGTEYTTAPNDQQLEVVDALTRSPHVDLVYGHHAHVPQPFDVVHGTWVAYGLGNLVAQRADKQGRHPPDHRLLPWFQAVRGSVEDIGRQPAGTFGYASAGSVEHAETVATGPQAEDGLADAGDGRPQRRPQGRRGVGIPQGSRRVQHP